MFPPSHTSPLKCRMCGQHITPHFIQFVCIICFAAQSYRLHPYQVFGTCRRWPWVRDIIRSKNHRIKFMTLSLGLSDGKLSISTQPLFPHFARIFWARMIGNHRAGCSAKCFSQFDTWLFHTEKEYIFSLSFPFIHVRLSKSGRRALDICAGGFEMTA